MLSPLYVSIIQFAVFPVLLAIVATVSLRSYRVPRLFLAFALIGAVGAGVLTYSFPADPAQSVMVSALDGDAYQSQSRIFREKINSYLHRRADARAVSFHRVLRSYSEAEQVMHGNGLMMVVWGNGHWVNISFPYTKPVVVSDFGTELDFSHLSKLQLVTSIPNVGLSFEPRNETSDYIAGLAAALVPNHEPTAAMALEDLGRRELVLMDTGSISGKWTAGAHRALPWWELGNLYSFRILRSQKIELGELRCAINAYYRARSFLQPHDKVNADLWSAVHNNLAVMTALQTLVDSQPKLLKRARQFLVAASKIRHLPNIFELDERPGVVAKQNLHILKGYVHKKPHAKRVKKSRKNNRT